MVRELASVLPRCLLTQIRIPIDLTNMTFIDLRQRIVLMALLLLCPLLSFSQDVTLFVEQDTFQNDGPIAVNVRASGIDDVAQFTFSLQWDTLVLQYTGVSNLALDAEVSSNFNQLQSDTGRLGYVAPLAPNLIAGYGVPDSTLLFTLNFTALTESRSLTTIRFVNNPTNIFFGRGDLTMPTDTLIEGTILVEGSSAIRSIAEDERLTVSPNPVTDYSQVELKLDYRSQAFLEVMDANGRTLSRRSLQVIPGRMTERLGESLFPSAGTYLIRLTTDREQITRKVIRR